MLSSLPKAGFGAIGVRRGPALSYLAEEELWAPSAAGKGGNPGRALTVMSFSARPGTSMRRSNSLSFSWTSTWRKNARLGVRGPRALAHGGGEKRQKTPRRREGCGAPHRRPEAVRLGHRRRRLVAVRGADRAAEHLVDHLEVLLEICSAAVADHTESRSAMEWGDAPPRRASASLRVRR